jgi:ABC-type nickel/cobalt efflux system permease component RcnA
MLDAWLGAALVMLLVLGIVRCVVAWLIYKEWQQQRNQQMELLPLITSAQVKHDSRLPQRNHHPATRPRPRERHAAHSVAHRSDR